MRHCNSEALEVTREHDFVWTRPRRSTRRCREGLMISNPLITTLATHVVSYEPWLRNGG
jgi:hypothetical protein